MCDTFCDTVAESTKDVTTVLLMTFSLRFKGKDDWTATTLSNGGI